MDIRAYNREAWNRQVADGNQWTIPVGPEVIAAAREGRWEVLLTPTKFVPRENLPLANVRCSCIICSEGNRTSRLLAHLPHPAAPSLPGLDERSKR